DAAAERDRHATPVRARAETGSESVRERVDGKGLAAHGGGFEQGQTAEIAVEAGRVGVDDAVAVDAEPDECPVVPPSGVPDQLLHRSTVARSVKGAEAPFTEMPDAAALPRPCEPGQARWVPCEPSDARRLGSTRAPFHMVLVLHGCAGSRTTSSTVAL